MARNSGQAAVEAALTLPLVAFLVLGALQLFMLLQAKTMAQYAVFQAARVGSVTHGRCDVMVHAALLALTPVLHPFMGSSMPGSAGDKLGTTFGSVRFNDYATLKGWSGESVMWLVRESPRFPRDSLLKAREHFDNPLGAGEQPVRLELRMIFWAPLVVPFADWVFTRMQLAHLGLRAYTAQNPLLLTESARWGATGTFRLEPEIASEYVRRANQQHYVFPIEVTSTMRMMSPVQASAFVEPNCPPTPSTL